MNKKKNWYNPFPSYRALVEYWYSALQDAVVDVWTAKEVQRERKRASFLATKSKNETYRFQLKNFANDSSTDKESHPCRLADATPTTAHIHQRTWSAFEASLQNFKDLQNADKIQLQVKQEWYFHHFMDTTLTRPNFLTRKESHFRLRHHDRILRIPEQFKR